MAPEMEQPSRLDPSNGIFQLFTESDRARILCHFLMYPDSADNVTDLVNKGVLKNRNRFKRTRDEHKNHAIPLLELGVLDKDGQKYKLNKEHHLIPLLESIYRHKMN